MKSPFVDFDRVEIAGIPSLKVTPRGVARPLPTAIYYHGWQSGKDNQAFRLSVFAAYGLQVFAPDAINHGERDPIDHGDSARLGKYFWETILQSVVESGPYIDEISSRHQADPARIGVMGNSMGGFTAAGVFAANPWLNSMVCFNGSCAWLRAEEVFRQKDGLDSAQPDQLQRLSRFDLLSNKERLQGRPVLMLHGGSDTRVPIGSQRFFWQQVAPSYKEHPEKLALQEFPGVGHYIDVKMLEQAVAWFRRYL